MILNFLNIFTQPNNNWLTGLTQKGTLGTYSIHAIKVAHLT